MAATSLASSVTDELTTLSETLRKDDEILLHPKSLVSAYDAEYSHKWSKVMQISDTATSDYSTHMGLEAPSLIVSAHFRRQTKPLRLQNTNLFFFLKSWAELFLSVTGESQRSSSNPNHFIVSLFVCVNHSIKKRHLPAPGYRIISWAGMFTNPLNNPSPVTGEVIYSLNL